MIIEGQKYLLGSGVPLDCFILSGQSNINGFNNVIANIPVGIQGNYPNIQVLRPDNSWVNLDSASNSSFQIPNTNGSWAVQYPLMIDIYNELGTKINVVQYAIGATSLSADWFAGGGTYWGGLISRIMTIKNCYNGVVNFKAFVWIQGEQDANALGTANAYEANLTAFVNRIRAYIGTTIPFFIVRLNINSTLTYASTVRAAQTAVCAALSSCYLIDSDSCAMQGDFVHYTAQGNIDLATNIKTSMIANGVI